MSIGRLASLILAAGMLLPALAPAARAGGEPVPASPGRDAAPSAMPGEAVVTAWLRGPFGRVPGGTSMAPAGADPGGRALDTWILQAPLDLQLSPGHGPASVSVTATPLEGAQVPLTLSQGATAFSGPGQPGRYLLTALITTPSGAAVEQAWLISVPDRQPPADGVLDIPAPDLIVTSGDGQLAGWPGTGCYAYLCVEVGTTPPPATLPSLAVEVGETLSLSLSDGSAMSAWKGTLTPQDGSGRPMLTGGGVAIEAPQVHVPLTGLEVPASGRWLLALEVEFDRERGFLRPLFVLEAR